MAESDLLREEKPKRVCAKCGRPLPAGRTSKYCERCEDLMLYQEVKEYILHHTVTEFEVADHFGIPLAKVREWIREGYIEYRKNS